MEGVCVIGVGVVACVGVIVVVVIGVVFVDVDLVADVDLVVVVVTAIGVRVVEVGATCGSAGHHGIEARRRAWAPPTLVSVYVAMGRAHSFQSNGCKETRKFGQGASLA